MIRKVCIMSMAIFTVLASVNFAVALTPERELGKLLYFDRYLSANKNQSCSTCHDPAIAGFADPLDQRLPTEYPVSVGSFTNLVGGRNAPMASYALFSPPFSFDASKGLYVGGQFWDGRAATLKDQAKGPFLNPVEMAMPDEASVIDALKDPANPNAAAYQSLFLTVFGIDLSGPVDVTYAYNSLAKAIAAFERSKIFKSFNSKYDAFIAMQEEFTEDELAGYEIFKEDTPLPNGTGAGKCFLCHPEPLFTDFTYDNLGIPKSKNKLIKHNPVDLGLGGVLDDPNEDGKFKVSSLRNLTFTPPYGHNGYFTSLEEIVHFYNTRDVKAEKWPAPEVSANVNHDELGNLGLTAEQEAQLVAFLKTLSDRPGMPSYPPTLP